MKTDQEYQDKCFRELGESLYKFLGSIDESEKDKEQELAKALVTFLEYPSLVASGIYDIIKAKKDINL